jgi:hypothetical protein
VLIRSTFASGSRRRWIPARALSVRSPEGFGSASCSSSDCSSDVATPVRWPLNRMVAAHLQPWGRTDMQRLAGLIREQPDATLE